MATNSSKAFVVLLLLLFMSTTLIVSSAARDVRTETSDAIDPSGPDEAVDAVRIPKPNVPKPIKFCNKLKSKCVPPLEEICKAVRCACKSKNLGTVCKVCCKKQA